LGFGIVGEIVRQQEEFRALWNGGWRPSKFRVCAALLYKKIILKLGDFLIISLKIPGLY
jgi:hypothetical protein